MDVKFSYNGQNVYNFPRTQSLMIGRSFYLLIQTNRRLRNKKLRIFTYMKSIDGQLQQISRCSQHLMTDTATGMRKRNFAIRFMDELNPRHRYSYNDNSLMITVNLHPEQKVELSFTCCNSCFPESDEILLDIYWDDNEAVNHAQSMKFTVASLSSQEIIQHNLNMLKLHLNINSQVLYHPDVNSFCAINYIFPNQEISTAFVLTALQSFISETLSGRTDCSPEIIHILNNLNVLSAARNN